MKMSLLSMYLLNHADWLGLKFITVSLSLDYTIMLPLFHSCETSDSFLHRDPASTVEAASALPGLCLRVIVQS